MTIVPPQFLFDETCVPESRRWLDYLLADPVGARIVRNSKTEATGYETPCWLRQGWCDGKGYRKIRVNGRTEYVHRWVWEFFNGFLRGDQEIHHRCTNRACFRPDHLEATTRLKNMREMNKRLWRR